MIVWALVSLSLYAAIVWAALQEMKDSVQKGGDPEQVRKDAMPALVMMLLVCVAVGGVLCMAWKIFLGIGIVGAIGFGVWWIAAKAIDRSLGKVTKPNDPA